jgi:HD-like signal output (HDOD) protein/CheY-like chemotaxis protein
MLTTRDEITPSAVHNGYGVQNMASGYRALIVDDDMATQRLVSHALRQQGFQCECAVDGEEAGKMAQKSHYHVVVTELKLPKKNGYALILELLKSTIHPVLVVNTAVIEPRLTKDLFIRGVDDILPKPVHAAFLGSKIRALVDRRVGQDATATASQLPLPSVPPPQAGLPVSLSQLNQWLSQLTTILPVSGAALDVYEMTRGGEWEIYQIAAAIQRDACLAASVLKLANNHLYNPTGQPIDQLEQAVMRIGQNRVGELALATSALSKLTPEVLPWLDLELTWKRSMAAGLVMDLLVETGGHQEIEEGLLLSAIMYPLGRVALGMLFPKAYEEMVAHCNQTGESLQEQERKSLPTSHVQVMAHLLSSWNISSDVFLPLKFTLDEYSSLERLSDPLRTKAELVKVAIALGRLAAGAWHTWDLLQLPSPALLKRLKINNATEIIARAKSDLAKMAEFKPNCAVEAAPATTAPLGRRIAYCNFSGVNDDLLRALLPSLGLEPQDSLGELQELAVINCLSVPPKRYAAQCDGRRTLIVTDQDGSDACGPLSKIIPLPSSYGRFRDALVNPPTGPDVESLSDRTTWISRISRRPRFAEQAAAPAGDACAGVG